jgi:hypothetical protein
MPIVYAIALGAVWIGAAALAVVIGRRRELFIIATFFTIGVAWACAVVALGLV